MSRLTSFTFRLSVRFVAHAVFAIGWAFVLAWTFGRLTPFISVASLFLGWFQTRKISRGWQVSPAPWTYPEIALAIFVLFAGWKHFAWMMPVMPEPSGPSITTLSVSNYGDLPFHLGLVRFFAHGAEFLPLNPNFISEPLRYPFGVDLYSALWESLGVPTVSHFFIFGMLATFATLVFLRELGGVLAMASFFLAGMTLNESIDWKNLFLSVWITQRGFLLALPMGLMLILGLRRSPFSNGRVSVATEKKLGWIWAWFPLIHAHSFVIVSLILFVSRLFNQDLRGFFQSPAFRRAFIPASLLIFHTSAGFQKASVVRLKWIWTWPSELPSSVNGAKLTWFEFGWDWFQKNFSWSASAFFLGLAIVSLMVSRASQVEGRDDESRYVEFLRELGIMAGFFAVGLIVILAPWDWDNIKVLIWPWCLAFAALGNMIGRSTKPIVPVGLVLLGFWPGLQIVSRSWAHPKERSTVLWSLADLADAEGALRTIPNSALFAAATTPTHVLTYFGRLRVAGYEGHLWSHAIKADEVIKDLNVLMSGTDGWVQAAKRLKVTHIYWGPEERQKWGMERKPWQETLKRVASAPGHEVYVISEE